MRGTRTRRCFAWIMGYGVSGGRPHGSSYGRADGLRDRQERQARRPGGWGSHTRPAFTLRTYVHLLHAGLPQQHHGARRCETNCELVQAWPGWSERAGPTRAAVQSQSRSGPKSAGPNRSILVTTRHGSWMAGRDALTLEARPARCDRAPRASRARAPSPRPATRRSAPATRRASRTSSRRPPAGPARAGRGRLRSVRR